MDNISIETVNKILFQIGNFPDYIPQKFDLVTKTIDPKQALMRETEGMQSDSATNEYVYSHVDLPENLFVKVITETDSYGYEEKVQSIQLVFAKKKTVLVYE